MKQSYEFCLSSESNKTFKTILALLPYYIESDKRLSDETKESMNTLLVRFQKCFDSFHNPNDTLLINVSNIYLDFNSNLEI